MISSISIHGEKMSRPYRIGLYDCFGIHRSHSKERTVFTIQSLCRINPFQSVAGGYLIQKTKQRFINVSREREKIRRVYKDAGGRESDRLKEDLHVAGYLRRKYRSLLGNFPGRNTSYC